MGVKKENNYKPNLQHHTKCKYLKFTCILIITTSYFKHYLLHCLTAKLNSIEADESQWYFTLNTAHRKTKPSTLYFFLINWLHRVFTFLTSCLNDSTCVKCQKTLVFFFQRLVFYCFWDVCDTQPLCAWCELPHWRQWPCFTVFMRMLCLCSPDASCLNWRSGCSPQQQSTWPCRPPWWRVSLLPSDERRCTWAAVQPRSEWPRGLSGAASPAGAASHTLTSVWDPTGTEAPSEPTWKSKIRFPNWTLCLV